MTSQPGLSGSSASAAKRAAATSENRRRRPDEHRRAVEGHHDAEVREVEVGRVPRPDYEPRRRRIVGDDVRQRELECLIARIDELHRRRDCLDSGKRLQWGHGTDELAFEQKRDLGLDARMHVGLERRRASVLDDHAVGEPAPDHVVDAHLHHLLAAGETHLDSDLPLAAGVAAPEAFLLYRVGIGERDLFRELRNLLRVPRGVVDALRESFDVRHGFSPKIPRRRTPRGRCPDR